MISNEGAFYKCFLPNIWRCSFFYPYRKCCCQMLILFVYSDVFNENSWTLRGVYSHFLWCGTIVPSYSQLPLFTCVCLGGIFSMKFLLSIVSDVNTQAAPLLWCFSLLQFSQSSRCSDRGCFQIYTPSFLIP